MPLIDFVSGTVRSEAIIAIYPEWHPECNDEPPDVTVALEHGHKLSICCQDTEDMDKTFNGALAAWRFAIAHPDHPKTLFSTDFEAK